jgi:CRP-like cAMP-binding protein
MLATASISQNPIATPWANMGGVNSSAKTIRSNEPLFCEGDKATNVYEVLEGVLCCYKIFADGRRQVISFAFPGDLVGFGHGNEYRFDCDAISEARVSVIPQTSLLRAVAERPELGERLLQLATSEVASMQDHSFLLGRKSAIEKISSFLLSLAKRANEGEGDSTRFQLPMTRADIADFLGLTVETVSRTMTKLRLKKIIDLPNPATFVVNDMAALRDMADCERCFH